MAGASPLEILQRAVLERCYAERRDNGGPRGSERDFIYCVFCDADAQFFDYNFWGSVSSRIQHAADCPVLVARGLPPIEINPAKPGRYFELENEARDA